MKIEKIQIVFDGKVFRIEKDAPDAGCYLYVYSEGKRVHDARRDGVKECIDYAAATFGVPLSTWGRLGEDAA